MVRRKGEGKLPIACEAEQISSVLQNRDPSFSHQHLRRSGANTNTYLWGSRFYLRAPEPFQVTLLASPENCSKFHQHPGVSCFFHAHHATLSPTLSAMVAGLLGSSCVFGRFWAQSSEPQTQSWQNSFQCSSVWYRYMVV